MERTSQQFIPEKRANHVLKPVPSQQYQQECYQHEPQHQQQHYQRHHHHGQPHGQYTLQVRYISEDKARSNYFCIARVTQNSLVSFSFLRFFSSLSLLLSVSPFLSVSSPTYFSSLHCCFSSILKRSAVSLNATRSYQLSVNCNDESFAREIFLCQELLWIYIGNCFSDRGDFIRSNHLSYYGHSDRVRQK